MKTTLITTLALAAATIGIIALSISNSSHDARVEQHLHDSVPLSAPDSNARKPHASLISQQKLDAKVVQPLGQKAFAISRRGAFRPSGDARDFILSRAGASEAGDSTATFEMYLAALDCRSAASLTEIQSAASLSNKEDQQAALESSDARLNECSSLLKDPALSPPGKWLLKAAQQGSVEAMLLYATDTESAFGGSNAAIRDPEAVIAWKRDAASFLNAAASQGSVDALVALGRANTNGIIVEKNPTEAYAYYLAAERAMPSALSEKLLGMYREELSSAQQQAATSRADAIYKNCCQ